jgi:nucleoside-diphosphate-sugar epimerase
MKFLVTGGSGFIGAHLLRRLAANGHALSVVVNRRQPELPEGGSVKYLKVDLEDPTALRGAGFKTDVAINMAGLLRKPGIPDESYWKVHYESTKHLLEECTRFKVRHLMLVSTTGVYGATGRTPRGEEGPYGPTDIYEKTKLEAERYAREYCAGEAINLTIVRPALVYGPGDLHLLALFKGIQKGYFRMVGDGANLLHPIFIDDLVDGMMRSLPGEAAAGATLPPAGPAATRVFNFAGERPVAFREFCETIARALGRRGMPKGTIPVGLAKMMGAALEAVHKITRLRPPLTRETVKFMTSDRAYDITRARETLGWSPKVGLEPGIASAVAWYRDKGLLN